MNTKTPPSRELLLRAFAICVRELRAKVGLSQEDLAYQAGIDRAYMGTLERGEHSPSLEIMHRLFPPLNISFADFAVAFDRTLRRLRRDPNVPHAAPCILALSLAAARLTWSSGALSI